MNGFQIGTKRLTVQHKRARAGDKKGGRIAKEETDAMRDATHVLHVLEHTMEQSVQSLQLDD
jgi:hypothetical protein